MQTKPFDVAEHLTTDEDIRLFLEEAASIGTAEEFVHALGTVARAKGMTHIANDVGVGRASLYKSLSENGNPAFETVFNVIKACGFTLAIH